MTQETVDNILIMFDEAIDKVKGINGIAKVMGLPREEIVRILLDNGRGMPKKRGRKPKEPQEAAAEEIKEPQEAAAEIKERILPIPNYIFDVLFKELDRLDADIEVRTKELLDLNQRYTEISQFIKTYRPDP